MTLDSSSSADASRRRDIHALSTRPGSKIFQLPPELIGLRPAGNTERSRRVLDPAIQALVDSARDFVEDTTRGLTMDSVTGKTTFETVPVPHFTPDLPIDLLEQDFLRDEVLTKVDLLKLFTAEQHQEFALYAAHDHLSHEWKSFYNLISIFILKKPVFLDYHGRRFDDVEPVSFETFLSEYAPLTTQLPEYEERVTEFLRFARAWHGV